jgi:branched-chain amino acid transport system substrate-binding protein
LPQAKIPPAIRKFILATGLTVGACLCHALLSSWLSAAATPATNGATASPFLRLRDQTLGYHGADDAQTDLTEVRIGWFAPQETTNHRAADMWWAANLAIRNANECGGLEGRPFRLVPCWTDDPWGSGVARLARMVFSEQPVALLGSVDSASTHLAEQVVAKANLPLISPVSTDPTVTLAGVSWMFSCAPSDTAIAQLLTDAILAAAPASPRRVVMFSTTDHESRMSAREIEKQLMRRGRSPDYHFELSPGTTDLSRQLSSLSETRPAAVVIVAGDDDSARLVRAVGESVPLATVFGGPSFGRARFRALAGRASENVVFPLLFNPEPADADCARFMNRFKAEHQRMPDNTAALTYDATRLLLDAIRLAGPSRARIRETLTRLSPWRGITGEIRFDGTGQNIRAPHGLGTIRNGVVVLLPS